jgi:hypothetical protein
VDTSVAFVVVENAFTHDALVPWIDDDPRVSAAPESAFADVPAWVDTLEADHVVIAARPASGRVARLAATTLTGARPGVAVVHRVVPTTSIALAASALNALESGSDAVGVLRAFDQLSTRSSSGAWLRSVTRLENPKPGLGLHVRSFVSRGFVAMTTPTPSVGRTLEAAMVGHPLLVGADAASAEFAAVVALAGGLTVQSVPALADVKAAYGSAGAEFVALEAVSPSPEAYATCPVCDSRQSAATCPFCHVHLRVSEPA